LVGIDEFHQEREEWATANDFASCRSQKPVGIESDYFTECRSSSVPLSHDRIVRRNQRFADGLVVTYLESECLKRLAAPGFGVQSWAHEGDSW
jgi:hypothetical protein